QQEKKMEGEAMTAIASNKDNIFNDKKSPAMGNKTAPATVVEFFDYQCGHCRQMAEIVEELLAKDKNIYFIFKELPIFGAQSAYAAKAALAAAQQSPEKYLKFHNALFESKKFSEADVLETAKKVGLNIAKLKKDMNSPAVDQEIRENFELAKALKIPGTPVFIVANQAQTKFKFIPGATTLDDLQAQIKAVQ
ncbi:MAG TPA: DsbA family protein, partial [Gammaproteobacteria bacterium]|nr:DsbA family protein [Gammaproteobacteria bacterium]